MDTAVHDTVLSPGPMILSENSSKDVTLPGTLYFIKTCFITQTKVCGKSEDAFTA